MKVYFILNRRFLFALFLSIVFLIMIVGRFSSCALKSENGKTHKQRIDFIENLGYKVDESSVVSKDIVIPYNFSNVYTNYNKIQQKAGFDLANYKGKKVVQYSFCLLDCNSEKLLNLLVYDGVIIGGDVTSVKLNGEISPLLNLRNNKN